MYDKKWLNESVIEPFIAVLELITNLVKMTGIFLCKSLLI